MAREVNCRKGLHQYSPARDVGAGIARRVCTECGLVQIDLNGHEQISTTELFQEPKLATMFEVEALLAQVGDAVTRSTFGEPPAGRRRPAGAFG